jgi:L-fucose mutarotase
MLNGIPKIFSPELLGTLCEMGHSDQIVLADGNFPVGMYAKIPGLKILRADGHGIPELLDAILTLMPLDTHTDKPVSLMQKMDCDRDMEIPIIGRYEQIVAAHDARGRDTMEFVERFAFYEKAKLARAIVYTGESAIYANIIVQKGVL